MDQAPAHGQMDVAGPNVVSLEVHKLFGRPGLPACNAACPTGRGKAPVASAWRDLRLAKAGRSQPGSGHCGQASGRAVQGAIGQAHPVVDNHRPERRACMAGPWQKTGQGVAPNHFAGGLAMQMDHRAEPPEMANRLRQGGGATLEVAATSSRWHAAHHARPCRRASTTT